MLGSVVASIGHTAQRLDLQRAESDTRRATGGLREALLSDGGLHAQRVVASLDVALDAWRAFSQLILLAITARAP